MRDSLQRLAETCDRPWSRRECPLLHSIEEDTTHGARDAPESSYTCTDVAFIARQDGYTLFPDLLRLLAKGEPLPLETLARQSGESVGRVASVLGAQSGTEWDEEGRLVGFGLTLRTTPHQFVVDGHELHTWCATDTLLFTIILGRDTAVRSRCPATGHRVEIDLSPDGPRRIDPLGAVVSEICSADVGGDLRTVVCDHGHFFASATHAQGWLDEHVDGRVRSVSEAFRAARATCEALGWVGSLDTDP